MAHLSMAPRTLLPTRGFQTDAAFAESIRFYSIPDIVVIALSIANSLRQSKHACTQLDNWQLNAMLAVETAAAVCVLHDLIPE